MSEVTRTIHKTSKNVEKNLMFKEDTDRYTWERQLTTQLPYPFILLSFNATDHKRVLPPSFSFIVL